MIGILCEVIKLINNLDMMYAMFHWLKLVDHNRSFTEKMLTSHNVNYKSVTTSSMLFTETKLLMYINRNANFFKKHNSHP